MTIDANLIADIDKSESCELTAYKDTEGLWTIGWGHELGNAKDWTGTTWTQLQADTQRNVDIAGAQAYAKSLPEWQYLDTPCRQNAVVELCFNMGKRWLAFVNTRAAIEGQDWQKAHDGLLASLWASEVHPTRANRLADYLLTGAYPA